MQEPIAYPCPYCGETLESLADPTVGPRQEYVEDCQVCCRPIVLSLSIREDGRVTVSARPES